MPATDDYWFDSQVDVKRLSNQHRCIKQSMNGRLVVAPIDLSIPRTVYDSATSDGYWLYDFAKDYSAGHTLVGSDIDESRFPKNLPDNVTLTRQDMHEPYPKEWFECFDFVHQRLLLAGSRGDPRKPLSALLDLVKPGGWVQLIEAVNECGPDDGPAMRDFIALMVELFSTAGNPPHLGYELAKYLGDAGFVKIGTFLAPYSVGAKCPDPALRGDSIEASAPAIAGMANVAKKIPNLKCLNPEQLESLTERFSNEMAERGGYFPMQVVWAQKPLK